MSDVMDREAITLALSIVNDYFTKYPVPFRGWEGSKAALCRQQLRWWFEHMDTYPATLKQWRALSYGLPPEEQEFMFNQLSLICN